MERRGRGIATDQFIITIWSLHARKYQRKSALGKDADLYAEGHSVYAERSLDARIGVLFGVVIGVD